MWWTSSLANQLDWLNRELDRSFGSAPASNWSFPFSRFSFLPGHRERAYPLVNITEDADCYFVHALAPGLDPEKLEVSVTGNRLTISGDKTALPEGIKAEWFHRSERATGRFSRWIDLPSDVDPGHVTAGYHNGLLQITIPKAEVAKPKLIQVAVD